MLHNSGRFNEKYVRGEYIASGGFGAVYKCNLKKQKEIRAVKVISKFGATLDSFKLEMDMLSKLPHPKIIQVYEMF